MGTFFSDMGMGWPEAVRMERGAGVPILHGTMSPFPGCRRLGGFGRVAFLELVRRLREREVFYYWRRSGQYFEGYYPPTFWKRPFTKYPVFRATGTKG